MNSIGINRNVTQINNVQSKGLDNSWIRSSDFPRHNSLNMPTSGLGNFNLNNINIMDTYRRMSYGNDVLKSNINNTKNDYVENIDEYKEIYFDKSSGESFEFVKFEGGVLMSDENFKKFSDLYPAGSSTHSYKISEILGNAREIDGIPIQFVKSLDGKNNKVNVFNEEYNVIMSHEIGELNAEYFFNNLENFEKKYDIKNFDFWEKFLKEL